MWLAEVRGLLAAVAGDNAAALQHFRIAADQADLLGAAFDADLRFRLRIRQGGAERHLGRWDLADATFHRLLSGNETAIGPSSPDVLLVRFYLAEDESVRHRPAQALALYKAIEPAIAAAYGPDHKFTSNVLAGEAISLEQLGRYDEAVRIDLEAQARADALPGDHRFDSISYLNNAANATCRTNQIDAGLARASQAHDRATSAFGAAAPLTSVTATTLAFCLIRAHRGAEAAPLLDNVELGVQATLAGDPEFARRRG